MLKVENLSKKFNGVYAVKDLSFEVDKGKVFGLLGPNGAGKTTTMRLMTGYIRPDEGDVIIDDVSVATHPKEAQKNIGYMPEANPLYDDMLVSELFELFADLKNIPKSKRKNAYDFVVDSIKLNEVFYRPIKELSKGYKQRTGLAIALLNRPKTIILDEPTEGLDPNQRTDIRALIKDLSKESTIIISTHVMQEAQAICDHLFIIANGGLVADGTSEELSSEQKKNKTFDIVLEGKKIEEKIRALPGIENVKLKSKDGNKISISLVVSSDVSFQPKLSELIISNHWIVWNLSQHKEKLEDVFYKLTKSLD